MAVKGQSPQSGGEVRCPEEAEILVVEDDAVLRMLTVQILEVEGYDVRVCAGIDEARRAIEKEPPDCVILDMQLPDGSGMDLLRALREGEQTAGIPVVVVTGTSAADFIGVALAAGAQDFIRKPFEPVELVARVGSAVRVKRMHDELTRLATHDALTGLPNRRGLLTALETWLAHRSRSGEHLSIVMFDVINFKGVNDAFGHSTGDRVLREVGSAMLGALRAADVLGRWGGDEFLAVLPGTDGPDAELLIGRLRERVCCVELPGRVVEVRVGLAVAPPGQTLAEDLLVAASDNLHHDR